MGIGKNEFNFLLDPLNSRLNGLKLLPIELRRALSFHTLPSKKITVIDEPEQTTLDQLDSNQEAVATKTILSEYEPQNPLIDPKTIGPNDDIKALLAANIPSETTSTLTDESKQALLEDKPTEKPQLSFGQIFVPLVLPGPLGTLVNVFAQQGNATKENKKEESQPQGTGAESSTEEGQSENQTRTSFWDTLSKGFASIFKPLTKPLVAIWNNQIPQPVKDLFSKEKLMSLFSNKNNDVAQREKQLAQKLLQETTLGKQRVVETENKKRQIVSELIAREDRRRAEQARLDAIDEAARQAALAKANKDTLTALSDQQRKEAVATELASTETNKPAVNETKESLRRRLISVNNNFNFSLNPDLVGSNTSFADIERIIKKAMIENPTAGLAYLYSMGKDLYSLSNNRMFRSNDSVNMTTVLANYINSGSDPTTAPKPLINESLTQTGTTTLYNA